MQSRGDDCDNMVKDVINVHIKISSFHQVSVSN